LLEAGLAIARSIMLTTRYASWPVATRQRACLTRDAISTQEKSARSSGEVQHRSLRTVPQRHLREGIRCAGGARAEWCARTRSPVAPSVVWTGLGRAESRPGGAALPGYTFENWLRCHKRLVDIGLKYAGDGLAVNFRSQATDRAGAACAWRTM